MDHLLSLSTILPVLLLSILIVVCKSKSQVNLLICLAESILVISAIVAVLSLILLLNTPTIDSITFGAHEIGLLFRIDHLSTAMLFMVSIIGFVVVRYSKSYLMGDPKHLTFIRRLLLTVVLVQLLMIAGSLISLVLFWSATSISLHYLLIFYKERKNAQYSAKKKFIVARVSDITLVMASILLFIEFDTVSLDTIFQKLQVADASLNLIIASIFVVLTAILKSAQVPFHGWLLEVMEAPTPVSGLLHAGLLNAGPFLVIRFAFLMEVSSIGSTILLVVGGITALYGTIVFPSQPAVKTALAYSSVAHMGFSLMTCGLGLYSASLLHLVGHSFYKAHSFLSSGSMVEKYRLSKLRKGKSGAVHIGQVVLGVVITSVLYVIWAEIWGGVRNQSAQMYILGSIILIGLSTYMINAMKKIKGAVLIRSIVVSSLVLLSFFFLEHVFDQLLSPEIPENTALGWEQSYVACTILVLFTITVITSILETSAKKRFHKWEVFKRNGFYLHIVVDKFLRTSNAKTLSKIQKI